MELVLSLLVRLTSPVPLTLQRWREAMNDKENKNKGGTVLPYIMR